MSSPIQLQVFPFGGPFTRSRIGVVVSSTPNSMFVDVGDTVLETAFLLPFTATTVAPPAAGTVVQLVCQDSSWVAVGRVVGAGSNAILNPSFEDSPPGAQPANWFSGDAVGTAVAMTVDIADAPDGDLAARVTTSVTAVHILYSSPIAVNAGDVWSLSAYAGGDYSGGPPTADAGIVALWFANATDLWPTTSSPDTLAVQVLDIPQYPPFTALYANVTAPVSGFMRVALRSDLVAGQALVWDQVVARKA